MEEDTLFMEKINLKIECLGCGNRDYQEHESGAYVCIHCGVLSTILHNQELDLNDKGFRSRKGKFLKLKIAGEEEDEGQDDYETGLNTVTNIHTSLSDLDGMRTPRFSYIDSEGEEVPIKSAYQILVENQKIFTKILGTLCNFLALTDPQGFDLNTRETMQEIAKSLWVDYVNTQGNFTKQKKLLVRSRRNTEDHPGAKVKDSKQVKKNAEVDETSEQQGEDMHAKDGSKVKASLNSRLNSRKLVKSEILEINDYKSKNYKSRDKIKRYLEEYDQVEEHLGLNKRKNNNESYDKHNDKESLSYDYLLKYTKGGINDDHTAKSYEELVHNVFLMKNLNYKHLYKELAHTEEKHFNPDIILAMIAVTLESIKAGKILFKHLVSFYKNSDYITNTIFHISKAEIKLLKFINKEKLLRNSDMLRKKFRMEFDAGLFFKNVCSSVFRLPDFFSGLCSRVYDDCKGVIMMNSNYLFSKEVFCLGIIFYCLKLFYGLNDLGYLTFLLKDLDQTHFLEKFKTLSTLIELKQKLSVFGERDTVFKHVDSMPSLPVLLNQINDSIKHDDSKKVPWEGKDFKEPFCQTRQAYYSSFISKVLLHGNDSLNQTQTHNKTLEGIKKNFSKATDSCMVVEATSDFNKTLQVNVNASSKFREKQNMKRMYSQRLLNAKESLSNFLKEEVDYYKSIEFKQQKNPEKRIKISMPLPCDDIIAYKKQAFKFEGIMPPIADLMVNYFFKTYFKVDYRMLRKSVKIIAKTMETKFKIKAFAK